MLAMRRRVLRGGGNCGLRSGLGFLDGTSSPTAK